MSYDQWQIAEAVGVPECSPLTSIKALSVLDHVDAVRLNVTTFGVVDEVVLKVTVAESNSDNEHVFDALVLETLYSRTLTSSPVHDVDDEEPDEFDDMEISTFTSMS